MENKWMTTKDLQLELGMSLSTQSKLRMNKTLPYHKLGKKVLYKRADIDEMIENNKIKKD